MIEKVSRHPYVDCVWFKEKGTIRLGSVLEPIPANSLVILAGAHACYGKSYMRLSFLKHELEKFKQWMQVLGGEVSALFALSSCRSFQTMPLEIRNDDLTECGLQSWEKSFREDIDLWRFFLAMAFNFEAFGKIFPQMRRALGEERAMQLLLDFLNIFACEPESMREHCRQAPKVFRKLNRYFFQKKGTSIKKYMIKIRLRRAAELLSATRSPLAEVADRCGFMNHAYFSAKFRKEYSVTPRAWRQIHQCVISNEYITRTFPTDVISEDADGYISTYNANA